MPVEPNKALIQTLKKIPIFNDLSPTQIQKVLSVCHARTLEALTTVCRRNSPGDEMYILLSGQLLIKKPDGTPVVTISPVTTVGEVGLITRQPRSVDIETTQESMLLSIQRKHFELLLRDDPDMPIRIYRNIISILSSRFLKDNVRACDFQLQKARIALLEHKLKVAVGLLGERGLTPEEAERAIADRVEQERPRVLIVDDEAMIRKVIRRALPEFEVLEAENGRAALEAIEKQQPDLVISDIRMPEMDGFELLSTLRTQYPDLPVLGISGYLRAQEAERYGFDGFLDKPVQIRQLKEQVEGRLKKEG